MQTCAPFPLLYDVELLQGFYHQESHPEMQPSVVSQSNGAK